MAGDTSPLSTAISTVFSSASSALPVRKARRKACLKRYRYAYALRRVRSVSRRGIKKRVCTTYAVSAAHSRTAKSKSASVESSASGRGEDDRKSGHGG